MIVQFLAKIQISEHKNKIFLLIILQLMYNCVFLQPQ